MVKASGLMMFAFGGLLLICALSLVGRRLGQRPGVLRVDRVTATLGLTGAVGWLLTSAVLYITYRPYSEIFDRYIRAGDVSQIRELYEFLSNTSFVLGPLGMRSYYLTFYFWTAFTLLGLGALSLLAARRIVRRRHATASA